MPDTKTIPEVGAIYLYADAEPTKPPVSRFRIVNYLRRKLKLDKSNIEDKREAIVKKSGRYRVRYTGMNGHRRKYLYDLYISLVDLRWRYALAIFFNVYLISFLFFAVIWWLIAYNHGDFENANNPKWKPCVSSVYDFPKCLLFSIETQTTIGYGVAYPNTDCDGTLLTVFLQITIGILLDNLLLGFIFVKFAQPKRRRNTIQFSKNACVTHNNGELAVQIRVGDMRKSHLLDAKVHGVLVKRHMTEEGVMYPLFLHEMKFQADNMDNKVVLMWPMILTHQINEDSPFWSIKPADLCNEKYELIVYIEGTIETTGEFCQARTSYTPREFLWGHRFDRIEEFDTGNARWEIDFACFNDVVYSCNIRHSAKELATFKANKIPPPDINAAPINTTKLKSFSYDLAPELPSRDRRGIRFNLGKGAEPQRAQSEESLDDLDDNTGRRGSAISYQTADEESVKERHSELW